LRELQHWPEQPHMSLTVLGISVEHSVISKTDGKFTKYFDASEQGTFTAPTQPGEYAFYCKYHPNMKGTLIVK
jgi:plastocyanin